MSATNRGSRHKPNDFYPTPDWLTEAMIPHPRRILEPAVGGGATARILEREFPAG
jgi:hypothetical protein